LLSWLLLPFALILSGESRGDEPARPPKEAPDRAQVERLIRQLGSDEFKEREAASRQLEKIGPPAMEALRAAGTGSKDAEVRRRAADVAAAIENTLEQLVIDYRSFGLPLPPKEAKLARYKRSPGPVRLVNGKVQPEDYGLAFQLKPGSETEGPTLLQGTFQWQPSWVRQTQELDPKPEALKDLSLSVDGLGLAIQCDDRGWHKLAQHLLERIQKDTPDPPRLQLLRMAWVYWEGQLTQPKIDRAPIAKRLKELIARDNEMDTEGSRAFLKSLELALVPSKAKPGSIEALIDDLVDYGADTERVGLFETEVRYLRIAELGFDAVPALIKHLHDERLTRGRMGGFNNFFGYHLQVRHVVSDLLEGLAGQEIDRDWVRRLQGYAVEKAAAKKWWNEARKIGEEAYLLKHVLPAAAGKDDPGQIDGHQLQVIMAKYPKDLPTLYRTVLDKRPELDSETVSEAVCRSTLPAKEKLDLFRYAAKHKDRWHCLNAFDALKNLDKKEFNALLLATIEAFPDDVPGPYCECTEAIIATRFAVECDDPRVWSALEKVAKRSAVGFRMELLCDFPGPEDARHRTERLRLLAAFLEDATLRDSASSDKYDERCAGFEYKKLAVRDFAAMQLARLLAIEVELNPKRGPEEWARIRGKVREGLDRARGGKVP
ncbi:MAG TPA: hypothetical protein VKA46_04420, partial [Gemmataceae bacterium]|nr:hypothetical protein [Gemmataceae bacterium]